MDINLLHQYVDFFIIKENKEKEELANLLFDSEIVTNAVKKFRYQFLKILKNIKLPFTCLKENIYEDSVYKDTYSNYYSKKHFKFEKNVIRLVIFEGLVSWNDFISKNKNKCDFLNRKIIGTLVIKPLNIGKIGMCYLNPYKMGLLIKKVFINLTEFTIYVVGNKLKLKAFPFSSQDMETITCAEISILNICKYFSNLNPEYNRISPKEISNIVSNNIFESNIPTRGLTIELISKILKDKGFNTFIYSDLNEGSAYLKKLLHYYIESGIPFIAIIKGDNTESGVIDHSIVAVGHGKLKDEWMNFDDEIVDSSQFFDKYIFMDDNEIPYIEYSYDNFCSSYMNKGKLTNIVVPLYKDIFMDAKSAFLNANEILKSNDLGYKNFINNLNVLNEISQENPIILRVYLAISDEFKEFRNRNSMTEKECFYYSLLPLPKYIWVVELTLKDLYVEEKIFGEIIMDSTSLSWFESLVAIRYPGIVTFRLPDQSIKTIFKIFNNLKSFYDEDLDNSYKMFIREL